MEQIDLVNFITISTLIFFVVAIIAIVLPRLISRRWNKHKAETVAKWEAEGLHFLRGPSGGKFGGLESMGANRVITGVGYAALTDKDLRVTRVTPSAAWIVTYKQIKSIAIQQAFMGTRSQKTPFIVVRFVKDGQADKLGFQVNDYETWAADLARIAGVSVKDALSDPDGD